MRNGFKALGVAAGAILALVAAALIVGGAALLWAWGFEREDGRFTTPELALEADGHAVVSDEIDLGAHPGDWIPSGTLADLRLEIVAGGDVFVGVAASEAVDAYLDGVPHAVLSTVDGSDTDYVTMGGTTTPPPPATVDIWEASVSGTPPMTLDWELEAGQWTVVAMNADGAPSVDVTVSASASVDWLAPAGVAVSIVGLLLGLVAAGLLVASLTTRESEQAQSTSAIGRPHPVAIEGDIDSDLSRGLWLVKWFLAIPHLLVLAFLWAGFVFSTIAAGVSILFTARYPRALFDYNVGVLRWSWRVAFYAFDALGTDRYPPFTLQPVDGYPTTLDVEYPGELSRGLVLVKWLLAIPHLVIVGLFTSGLVWWTTDLGGAGSDRVLEVGGGLISVLTLVAGVGLLVTGRYPRPVFDLLMGLNRWVYRVIAYVALMTDDYPPFRLDQGGSEPAPAPEPGGPGGSDSRVRTPTPA